MVLGPFRRAEINSLASNLGDMGRALISAAKKFMEEKLGMSREEVCAAGVLQACWTDKDCMLVKFSSVAQTRSLNAFKKNLPREFCADDFVPPCLSDHEEVFIRHGSILRAARVQGQPPVKTRRVWLRGTRVLQVKYGTSTY